MKFKNNLAIFAMFAVQALLLTSFTTLFFSSNHVVFASEADASVTIDTSTVLGQSKLALGVTYMQYNLDAWGDPTAVASGKALLQGAVTYHNQHLMGFGTNNPEPSPGNYDWSTLDTRINMIRSMNGIPVITLCCSPDWMKGGLPGQTDWSKIEVAPLPEHYADFAELARQTALRYPDVKYFQVWNEMKGFWNVSLNNWDYVKYTELYNLVYDALKSVSPDIKVGGPYLVIEGTGSNTGQWWSATPVTGRNNQVIDYWLANMHGADFITLDRAVKDYHDTNTYTQAQLLAYNQYFESVAKQILSKPKVQQLNLPLWWAEDYVISDPDWNYQAIGLASMLYHHVKGGASVSLRWKPQGVANGSYNGNSQNLFSDTRVVGGGQPYPNYDVYKSFHDYFGPGTQILSSTSSVSDLKVLASASKTLLINQRSTQMSVMVNGSAVLLNGYEVKVIPTISTTSTIQPPNVTTISNISANYSSARKQLNVSVNSAEPNAILNVYVTSTGQLLGQLTNNGNGKYSRQWRGVANPVSITIRSNNGESAISSVKTR